MLAADRDDPEDVVCLVENHDDVRLVDDLQRVRATSSRPERQAAGTARLDPDRRRGRVRGSSRRRVSRKLRPPFGRRGRRDRRRKNRVPVHKLRNRLRGRGRSGSAPLPSCLRRYGHCGRLRSSGARDRECIRRRRGGRYHTAAARRNRAELGSIAERIRVACLPAKGHGFAWLDRSRRGLEAHDLRSRAFRRLTGEACGRGRLGQCRER